MPIHPSQLSRDRGKRVRYQPEGKHMPYVEGKLLGRRGNKVVIELPLKLGGTTKVLLDPYYCTVIESTKFIGKDFS